MKPCPGENSKDMLLLKGDRNSSLYGRTFNNLLSITNAFYYARENDVQLGIMSNSWVFNILLKMWWAVSPTHEQDEWEANFEKAFCVKIFNNKKVKLLEGYNLLPFPEKKRNFPDIFFVIIKRSRNRLMSTLHSNPDSYKLCFGTIIMVTEP